MSRFIESIKIEDGQSPLLAAHQLRVDDTLAQQSSGFKIDLSQEIKAIKHNENGLFKWRLVYDENSIIKQELVPYFRSATKDFELIECNEIDYGLKYENRNLINQLCQQSQAQDIIIVKNKMVCDSSYANLIFKKGKQWYCPNTFLLNGVQRQTLLNKKSIKSTDIGLHNLCEFSHFQIINALNSLDEGFEYPIQKIINLPRNL